MPKRGFHNYHLTEQRQLWLGIVARQLGLNVEDRGVVQKCLDYTLQCTVAQCERGVEKDDDTDT